MRIRLLAVQISFTFAVTPVLPGAFAQALPAQPATAGAPSSAAAPATAVSPPGSGPAATPATPAAPAQATQPASPAQPAYGAAPEVRQSRGSRDRDEQRGRERRRGTTDGPATPLGAPAGQRK
jgi:hypothetical protein